MKDLGARLLPRLAHEREQLTVRTLTELRGPARDGRLKRLRDQHARPPDPLRQLPGEGRSEGLARTRVRRLDLTEHAVRTERAVEGHVHAAGGAIARVVRARVPVVAVEGLAGPAFAGGAGLEAVAAVTVVAGRRRPGAALPRGRVARLDPVAAVGVVADPGRARTALAGRRLARLDPVAAVAVVARRRRPGAAASRRRLAALDAVAGGCRRRTSPASRRGTGWSSGCTSRRRCRRTRRRSRRRARSTPRRGCARSPGPDRSRPSCRGARRRRSCRARAGARGGRRDSCPRASRSWRRSCRGS